MDNIIKIDKKDKRILEDLNWDARITNSQLAKNINLSKKGVEYRIKRLERLGIIQSYYPFINFMKLGYNYCRLFLKLQYLNETVKKEITLFIKSNKDFNWSIWAIGSYDLVIGMWTKSLKDFKKNVNKFILKFDKHIKNRKYSLGIQLDQFSYNFLVNENQKKCISMSEEQFPKKIDKIDFNILSILTSNAKISNINLAKKINLNPSTVKQRINRLINEEILLKTRADLNISKIGYLHYKLLLDLRQNKDSDLKKIKNFLLKKPNLIYFVDEIGISDFDLELLLESDYDLLELIKELQENFSNLIKDYQYFLFTNTIKINFMPADLENQFK
ncbi:AsnC family transcriptional regulator [Candidatus Pacearchaeota archaeon]|nr:AsnC family transcriptional regulator [Candidatus Pacearchaeota archaeon]